MPKYIAVIVRIRGYFDVIWQNSRFLPWGGLNEAYLRYFCIKNVLVTVQNTTIQTGLA